MQVLAWFSCGVTSAIACKLAIDKYGADNVRLIYIEIDSAHKDNDRFIADCEKWYGKSIERVRSNKYRDQFEVIEKTGYINGAFGARCTLELKKQVRFDIEKQGFEAQVFGFEFSKGEVNRAIRFAQQYPNAKPYFPLIERKIAKRHCAELLLLNGIELPAMYMLGYHNNNCIGCVKGGAAYWNKIRKDFPETFARMAELEAKTGASCMKKPLSKLNPKAGSGHKPILPDCGTFCEIEFADLIDPMTDEIISGRKNIGQLNLF